MMPERVSRQLVYLVYGGKPEYHQEAKYSILSALHHAKGACPRILLYTDEPEQFLGWPVDLIVLDADTLKDWTGPASYLHRRKAAAIRSGKNYWRHLVAAFFLRHGEAFSAHSIEAVREVPTTKPRPAWWHRLSFRLRSLFLSSRSRSHAKLAYYAAVMHGDPYAQACGRGYAEELRRKAIPAGESLGMQPWSKVLSRSQKEHLVSLLSEAASGSSRDLS